MPSKFRRPSRLAVLSRVTDLVTKKVGRVAAHQSAVYQIEFDDGSITTRTRDQLRRKMGSRP